jgi:hypothetical protein
MPADDEAPDRPSHYQHCLYLLAEAERMIDRAAAEWSPAEAAAITARIARIAERLTRALGRTH